MAQRLLVQAERYELAAPAIDRLASLLVALASEPAAPTTVVKAVDAVDVHVADSLSGLQVPALQAATLIADIGAGAGFPGLVLAAALPGAQVDLIEATGRKCEVIARLGAAAGIANARPVAARAEEWGAQDGAGRYGIVSARALSSLPVLAEYAAPLLSVGGLLVAWKGGRDPDEEKAGAVAAETLGLEPRLSLPVRPYKGSRERNLYLYEKTKPTPARFPRRPGMATKRPLGP